MLLQPEDAALFYRAWGALLTWVNDQRNIVPRFPRPTPEHPIDVARANPIRKAVWADDGLRQRFLAEAAADLGAAERDLIASWQHRVSGRFLVHRHLARHSIFMGGEVYGVLGIYTPLAVLFPHVPIFVDAVLIPFRDVIITDGIAESMSVQISFGPGARRTFEAQYRAAKTAGQVRVALPPRAAAQPGATSAPPDATKRPTRRRAPGRAASGGGGLPPSTLPLNLAPNDEEDVPRRPPGDITEPLDPEIAPLVEALRADGRLVTKGSCWGHGKQPAYVELAVEGVEGLRAFVERLNRVNRQVPREALLDVALNWSREVVTSCAFDLFPNWIMLALRVEGAGKKGAPSATLLKKIARLYSQAGS